MEPNKNIDRLFQEKLRDFEETPPDIAWENIEAHLDKKKKRRIIPIWWRYAGVAVILLLLTFSAFKYFNKANLENSIVDTDKNETPLIKNTNQPTNQNIDKIIVSTAADEGVKNNPSTTNNKGEIKKENAFKQQTSDKKESIALGDNNVEENITKSEQNKTDKLNVENSTSDKKDFISKTNSSKIAKENSSNTDEDAIVTQDKLKNPIEKTSDKNVIAQNDLPSSTNEDQSIKEEEKTATEEEVAFENLEDTLDDKYKLKEDEKVDELENRWSVATVVAPVFYNSFSATGSPLDLQFDNSPKQGSQSVSYGVKVGFKLNNKWSVQSGVSMIDMGYSVGDVYINPSPQGATVSRLTNIDYTSTATILNISTQNIINSNQIETSITAPIKGSLNQEYGYVEVPLEIKYSLTNGRLGVHLIGGFSTLFLNSNTVYVETPEFSSELGEARNLNNVDFSGNVGFDVDYSINKHFYFNVAPMLKVYTNTFSDNYENSDNFKPYLFGVYTGLNYRF